MGAALVQDKETFTKTLVTFQILKSHIQSIPTPSELFLCPHKYQHCVRSAQGCPSTHFPSQSQRYPIGGVPSNFGRGDGASAMRERTCLEEEGAIRNIPSWGPELI